MELFDTHCHIHEAAVGNGVISPSREKWLKAGITDADQLVADAATVGVTRAVCVGTTLDDSEQAVAFAQRHGAVWASIGIHPHDAKDYVDHPDKLATFEALAVQPKVVAVGECGLDYYYNLSPRAAQITLLEFQLDLAQRYDLALMFHIRESFDDFWPIFDNFRGLRGVVHSFTADTRVLDECLKRGLYVGQNGIVTFTKDENQLAAAKAIPLDCMLLETDAPYLTPHPYRGKVCTPSHVVVTAGFLAAIRTESLEELAKVTTSSAQRLLRI